MKKIRRRLLSLFLILTMAVSVTACGGSGSEGNGTDTDSSAANDAAAGDAAEEDTAVEDAAGDEDGTGAGPAVAAEGEKIINIGVTDSLGGVNPFANDQTELNKYAMDLMFLPLMELDKDLNFQPMLADSITTEDNIHFTVHIDEAATWSDGTPVTAQDVEYSVLRYASPVVANTTLLLYAFEGTDDAGFVEEGASSMAGLTVKDEKTIEFTAKDPMALTRFQNSYGRYLHILPKHVIEKFGEEELTSADWFNHPDQEKESRSQPENVFRMPWPLLCPMVYCGGI